MEKVFLLQGLDCPNCAAKIENEVGALTGVKASTVNLMKQTLTIRADEETASAIMPSIEAIVHTHEPDVAVSEYDTANTVAPHDDHSQKTLIRLLIGAAVFAIGFVMTLLESVPLTATLSTFLIAYLILGGDVVLKALKTIAKGRVFDENFLMSLSTIGAFAIGEYPEAVAVMLFYQIGEYFQDKAVQHSRRSIADLMDIRPDSATVVRGGEYFTVSPDTVAIGETIIVRPGEKIPLDGIVRSGDSMLDTVALTGESVPRAVHAGDEVLSGCINGHGLLTIEVTKAFHESTVSRILDLVENASAKKAPTEQFITTFAHYYTPVVVILAALLAVIPPLLFDGVWAQWIHRSLVFLVISCPCALVISIPLAFFGGIGAASKHGILIKGGNYLEALGRVNTVVFDKTGTLTEGVFKVSTVLPASDFTKAQVLHAAAAAESLSNHPIAVSILSAYGETIDATAIAAYEEVAGCGVRAVFEGKTILAGNQKLMNAHAIAYTPCDRVGTKVFVAVDGKFAGCILIADEIKADSRQAIAEVKRLGIEKTVMLTGDEDTIAEAVAKELGVDDYRARLLPDQKVTALEELDRQKRAGSKLAFVGDGINDAPVLARADIGIAMGAFGSDAAIEAADIVLMTDEPSKLTQAIKVAKATKRIVIQNIVIALSVKGAFLLLGAFGIAGMWEAVFGDVGVALIAVWNAMRIMKV